MNYLETISKRRSIYSLNDQIPLSDEDILQLIQTVTVLSPTAFNMQSSHILILMNQAHRELWELTTQILKKIVPASSFDSTQKKMNAFSNAKGTILFFDDLQVIEQLKKDFALYKDQFDMFASHSMGILQGNVWNALAEKNIGANLQHYNPLIDDQVKEKWNIPLHYQLTAQMVFGGILEFPEPKDKLPADQRVQAIY